ncbi:MAG: hypothetical protein ABIS67_04555, partial [Candidatus Eisenbacteria bacterium]
NAQSSRVEGMALQGDYIKDYTSIYSYPSSISHVGNLVYGEFGGGSDRAVGAVLGNLWEGRLGTWGVHLRQWEPNLGQATMNSHPGIGVGGQDLNANPNHSFDLMWGKRAGGTSIGVRVNRSFSEFEQSTATTSFVTNGADTNVFARNVFGVGFGVGFEVNPSSMFEVGVLWQSRTFENTLAPIGGGTNSSEDSPTSYQLAARLMWQWQPNVLVVPVFKWYSFDYAYKTTTGSLTSVRSADQKGWQIGVAGNWTLNQNDLFVLGVTAAQNTFEQDTEVFTDPLDPSDDFSKIEESIMPQVFAALETHVNPWLTIRFGATNDANVTIKGTPFTGSATPTTKATGADFNMQLGAGVKVGGLQFDAIMASDFYNRFTQLSSEDAPTFGKVTATYAF